MNIHEEKGLKGMTGAISLSATILNLISQLHCTTDMQNYLRMQLSVHPFTSVRPVSKSQQTSSIVKSCSPVTLTFS